MIQLISISRNSQQEGGGGAVEEIDGVTIIRNPQQPYYGELAIELEDDLEIGNDDDPISLIRN